MRLVVQADGQGGGDPPAEREGQPDVQGTDDWGDLGGRERGSVQPTDFHHMGHDVDVGLAHIREDPAVFGR